MPSDTLKDVAAGVAKGAIEWTEECINELAFQFKNNDLIFVEDKSIIKEAIAERSGVEWKTYSKYVTSNDLRILIQLGLTLRKLEGTARLQPLRDKIVKKYKTWGLHVAEFVQNEAIGAVVTALLPRRADTKEVVRDVEQLLREIDKYVLFVKGDTKALNAARDLDTRMVANKPSIVVVLGSGAAKEIAQEIWRNLKKKAVDYDPMAFEDKHKYIGAFFLQQ